MNEKELLAKGWLKVELWFEVMATTKELTESALKQHIAKLKKQEGVLVLEEKYEEILPAKNLPKGIREAYTQAGKVVALVKNVEILLHVVIFFAPSAVEVLEPSQMKITANTVQVIMNSVADLLHRFAAQGVGGVVIAGK